MKRNLRIACLSISTLLFSSLSFATNNYNTTDGSGAVSGVSSFNTRTGAVSPASSDYSSFYLGISNNLSDLANAGTARTNLGLGTSATHPVGDFVQTANNLSDVTAATARTNLGLGTSATHPSTDYALVANNLSDLANSGTAKTNLHATITCATSNWVNVIPGTTSNPTCTQPAFTDISGTVAATQLPNPSSTTLGGIKSLVATAHQWINTISTAGLPASTQPTTADVLATTTNDNAAAGYPGEIISCTVAVGSEISVTSATTLNICSVSLTAGDWHCSGTADVDANSATVVTYTSQGVSSVSATLSTNQDWATTFNKGGTFPVLGSLPFGPVRVSLASTTTHYFVFRSTFNTNVMSVYGTMNCIRSR